MISLLKRPIRDNGKYRFRLLKELFLLFLKMESFLININHKYRTKDRFKSVFDGLGTMKFQDGSIYQGLSKQGLFNGKGRMTHANGDIYQGEWKDGKACGKGTFVDQTGSMYKGEWLNDLYHGKGVETWNYNTIKYEGDFVQGQKTGKGRFEFDNNYY